MAASITVIIASQLGLPVSSTHIAVGGIFGVGFLREYLEVSDKKDNIALEEEAIVDEKKVLKAYNSERKTLESKKEKQQADYERIVELYTMINVEEEMLKESKKHLKTAKKVQYVKRDAVKKIIAAWIITVPAAATISAAIFFMIKGIVL